MERKERKKNELSSCPICLEGMDDGEVTKAGCGHVFDRKCLDQWLDSQRNDGLETGTCPICRYVLRNHPEAGGWQKWPADGLSLSIERCLLSVTVYFLGGI